MSDEDKQLLLQDLCARLPYGVKCDWNGKAYELVEIDIKRGLVYIFRYDWIEPTSLPYSIPRGDEIKPYLRPMSSMTEKEKEELIGCLGLGEYAKYFKVEEDGGIETSNINDLHYVYFGTKTTSKYTDWLNANHFDYRCFIEKGLALEAPDGMYNTMKGE